MLERRDTVWNLNAGLTLPDDPLTPTVSWRRCARSKSAASAVKPGILLIFVSSFAKSLVLTIVVRRQLGDQERKLLGYVDAPTNNFANAAPGYAHPEGRRQPRPHLADPKRICAPRRPPTFPTGLSGRLGGGQHRRSQSYRSAPAGRHADCSMSRLVKPPGLWASS